jgi:hypothetical protein
MFSFLSKGLLNYGLSHHKMVANKRKFNLIQIKADKRTTTNSNYESGKCVLINKTNSLIAGICLNLRDLRERSFPNGFPAKRKEKFPFGRSE